MAFVYCQSWHGLHSDSGPLAADLLSLCGIGNVTALGGFGNYFVFPNFSAGQPGLFIQDNLGGERFVRFGPAIAGGNLFTSRPEWFVHFSYSLSSSTNPGTDLVRFEDLTVYPSPTEQCSFAVKNNGPSGNSFTLVKPDGTILAESPNFTQEGVLDFALSVKIDGSAGTSKLIVGGVTQWDETGLDTQATANATANSIALVNNSFNRPSIFGNIVIADDQDDGLTPPFNSLVPGLIVVKSQSNAAGDSAQFTPVGAATTHEAVDDYPNADDDTTYNETNAVSADDIHNFEDLPTLVDGIIYGIVDEIRHRKTSTGGRKLTEILKPTTTINLGPAHISLDTWQWFSRALYLNPDTAARFTESEFNAAKWGYRGETV